MLDFHDDSLDALKNALIDRLVTAPDLDVAALRHHLEADGFEQTLNQLFDADMTARLGGLVSTVNTESTDDLRVRAVLDEIICGWLEPAAKSNRMSGHR